MPLNGFLSTTSESACRFDFRLRAIWISVSKNKSNLPANGLLARRAPFAAVWMQPNDSVHHETIRLVSLSLRFRRRMAAVLSMQSTVAQASCLWGHWASSPMIPPSTGETSVGPTGKMPVLRWLQKSVPFLRFWPQRFQTRVEIAAKENVEVFVAPRIRMIGAADGFHAREMFAVSSPVAAENDHAFAGVIARTPKPIALMVADRFGQAVLLAKEIDRAGLAITISEDRRLRALLRRKRVVNPADFARHFLPAEFIREMLRQRSGRLVLRFRRLEPERFLITNVILR